MFSKVKEFIGARVQIFSAMDKDEKLIIKVCGGASLVLLLLICLLALAGCGQKEVGFDTLETSRMQARDNATWNAQKFRASDPRFTGLDIVSRGDSTQAPDCPQGDGWASVDMYNKDTGRTTKLKCSTVSVAVGCMTDDDFKGKVYAQDDGHCQPINKVPFPFRKISQ